mgnify:CR=1 FL=1
MPSAVRLPVTVDQLGIVGSLPLVGWLCCALHQLHHVGAGRPAMYPLRREMKQVKILKLFSYQFTFINSPKWP